MQLSLNNVCVWYLQDQVDNGIPLSLCLKQLARWLSSLAEKFGIVFNCTSTDNAQHPCTFATWSGNLMNYLLATCEFFSKWIFWL